MTTTPVRIEIDVRSNKADAELKRLSGELDKTKKAAQGASQAGDGLSKGFNDMVGKAGMAMAAVTAVAMAFDKVSDRSLKFQAVQSQVTVGINKARDATKGLVTDFDLMRLSNEAVRDGLVKTEEDFAKMSGLAVKLGLSVGKNATESVELLSNALDKLSARSLDSLGLAIDQDKAFADYAFTIGKTVQSLTEAEQKQALWNAVLQDGEAKLKGFNEEAQAGALTIQQFKTELVNLADEGFVYATTAIGQASSALAGFLEEAADFQAQYGLTGGSTAGISDANLNASFRRTSVRGLGGITGYQGEASRLKAESNRRNNAILKEASEITRKATQDMQILTDVERINADATDKMAAATERSNKSRKKKIDLFKEERAAFQGQFGQVEMGRASTSLRGSMDREQFSNQLDEAKMAEAGMNARKRQAEFEEEEHKKRVERNNEMNELFAKEAEAIKKSEEAKREQIKATMESRKMVADATAALTNQSVQLAGIGADAMIKSERRREQAKKALAGSELIVIGVVESVKAAAAFASFNYVEGALHVGAAALAFAKGGQLLSQSGGRGGGVGGAGAPAFAGGEAFGGGADTGGSTQSSSGGSTRPTSNGPVSEMEESVQRSGRGGRAGPTRQRDTQSGPVIQLFHLGDITDQSAIKLHQALKRADRKAGKSTT